MSFKQEFPYFDECFPFLDHFILDLVRTYNTGELNSWDELDARVKSFFTSEVMDNVEATAPGWKKMASYSEGITLTHVICVFLGMYMLPEFQALSVEQKQIAKWIILFHDIDKAHLRGRRDTMHAFNSAVIAANTLPGIGFSITSKYPELIEPWSEYTRQAFLQLAGEQWPKPDNQKLPRILSEIEELFGENTPATLIVKTALLHISLAVDKNYPTPSPLTDAEAKEFIDPTLFPLLKVMMLADNEGWSLFYPEVRDQQKQDALAEFDRIRKFIFTTNDRQG